MALHQKEKREEKGKLAFLALVTHSSNSGVTIKIPCELYVLLYQPATLSILSYWVG